MATLILHNNLVKNASGRRAAEVFMETTEEHKVLRPIERAKIHNSHTVTDKSPLHGKNWSYRASWRGGHVPKFAMRQQRKDESPKYKEAQRELRCSFSGFSLLGCALGFRKTVFRSRSASKKLDDEIMHFFEKSPWDFNFWSKC